MNKKYIWISFISSAILLSFAFKFYLSERQSKDVIQIKGLLKENIKIKKGRRSSKTLIIKLSQYPKIEFTIGGVSMGETYSRSLIDENKSGDSIIMLIDKKEFNRKILKIEKIPFPENYLHAEKISIREIHNKKFEYLSLKNYEKANRFNNYLAVGFFGLFGLLMLYIGTKGIIYHNSLN